MANVGIVSDSNCDLPEEVIKELDIGIVPGRIIFGDEVRRHYIDITYEEFYRRLVHDKATPSTSVPSPKEYKEAYEKALSKYDEIIVFCTSSKLSSMHNIAQMVAKEYFTDTVTVIDSQKISIPFGIVVRKSAIKAKEGATKDELLKYFNEHLLIKTHGFGGIPTLTYLQKGGRIGKVASLVGNLMNVKPVISIENGELHPLGKIRGMDKVYNLLVDFYQKASQEGELTNFVIGHTANYSIAEKLAKELQEQPNPPEDIQIIEFGPSVGTHLGPGGLFISWIGEFDKTLLDL